MPAASQTVTACADRGALVAQHAGLVRSIARRMAWRLPASVELDDLIQVGMIGLASAIGRFDAGYGAQFASFAARHIRGAMLDDLRRGDALGRGTRRAAKEAAAAEERLRNKVAHRPTEGEAADEAGVPLESFRAARDAAAWAATVSLDDAVDLESNDETPYEALLRKERMAAFEVACLRLSPIEGRTVKQLLCECCTVTEIAEGEGVSVSAVSQRVAKATRRLQEMLSDC